MRSSVEPLEGNKVKLSVEVDESEFDKAIDAAFRKIAREVRIPGFRPGKAPRRLLEARIGADVARQEALRDALPDYYARAVRENDVDVIAPPEIDITAGEEDGGVAFDAVVEVRPQIQVPGYAGLQVTIPSPAVTAEEIDAQIDRLRHNFAELRVVDRPAAEGDQVTIDISGTDNGEPVEGYVADDLLYAVGANGLPGLDDQLRGSKPGDVLEFDAEVPVDEEGGTRMLSFRVLVKEVKETVLPDVTDEWASEASEFDTVDELRRSIETRLVAVKKMQAQLAIRDAVVAELVKLVAEEPPEALVGAELERRIHDLGHRLEHQGLDLARYLAATNQGQEELLASLRSASIDAVKADLALRAVADAEHIEVDDAEVDEQIERLAQQTGQKPSQVRKQLERADRLPAVRSDIRKGKALEWLADHVELVDEEGNPIDRSALEWREPETSEEPETAPEETE